MEAGRTDRVNWPVCTDRRLQVCSAPQVRDGSSGRRSGAFVGIAENGRRFYCREAAQVRDGNVGAQAGTRSVMKYRGIYLLYFVRRDDDRAFTMSGRRNELKPFREECHRANHHRSTHDTCIDYLSGTDGKPSLNRHASRKPARSRGIWRRSGWLDERL